MKLAGISGKGRGRLGSMVFSSSAGEQIVRQYQPNVSNPNTTAQVAQRAKFKLMAQVAAAVSGEIIIPRDGLKSPRNQFQKKNFGLLSTDGDTATLQYEGLQFTAGNVAIPAVSATRAAGGINVALAAAANVSRVVYLAYRKSAKGALRFASSTIVNTAGDDNTFPATLDTINGEAVVYAYGMRDLSASATAKYGNYSVSDGTALATLVLSRTLSSSDYQFTRTVGATLYASTEQRLVSVLMEEPGGESVTITDGSVIPLPSFAGNFSLTFNMASPVSEADYGNNVQMTKVTSDGSSIHSLNPESAGTTLEFLPYGLCVSNISDAYLDHMDGTSTILSIDWGDETYDITFSTSA